MEKRLELSTIKTIEEVLSILFDEGLEEMIYTIQDLYKWEASSSKKAPDLSISSVLFDNGIVIKSGATKAVILSDDLEDWVIKINLPRCKANYCSLEARNYEYAEKEGIAQFFAETRFFKEINGIEFYLQRRADTKYVGDEIREIFYDYVSSEVLCADEYEDEDDFQDAVDEYIYDMPDEDRFAAVFGCWEENIVDFLISNEINDLHDNNFGRINGDYCLIDYSGF